jgi:hypothetical protein
MKKMVVVLGVSMVAFGGLSSGAQARKVYYEINGQRYSYSTNNAAQTAEAKKRIEAAKAADSAKAKAEAEKSQSPLKAVFGSPTQREANKAQKKLEELMSGKSPDTDTTADTSQSSAPQQADDQRGKRLKVVREASAAPTLRTVPPVVGMPMAPTNTPVNTPVATAAPAVAEPVDLQHRMKVKSVSFDVESGIKTTIMVDGTIQEEPFDSGVLSALVPEQEEKNSLTAFVKQLRRVPEEVTGSIRTSVAYPVPELSNRHH